MNEELPETERANPASAGLDTLSAQSLAALLVREQRAAVDSVARATPQLAAVIERTSAALAAGGSLHYAGAGTSGRLGVLDASEMPPTFGTPPSLVCAHIAGDDAALRAAIEGAEDDAEAGAAAMRGHVEAGDVVIGISASGRAPYVSGALHAAREIGAYTVAIVDVEPPCPLTDAADASIVLRTGAEPLAGSTRLKAGTAQKIALNIISTGAMVRLGKVYDNLMVDVVATNAKLRARARRLVENVGRVDSTRADALLYASGGSAKVAIAMARLGIEAGEARRRLEASGGFLRDVLP